ncbi:MAG TPA: CoA transferase [Acidimicrobiales bacterium]|nr:CoA transferase [Acidimicrobiales bacterium]
MAGVRVVDFADELEMTGRFLADMGADVIRVERPGGARSRTRPPFSNGTSLHFATRNSNKRSVELDVTAAKDRDLLWRLLERSDIWIESASPGSLAKVGLDPASVLDRLPALVILSISSFGQTGPYRDYVATDPVHLALGSQLSRFGLRGREPLVPPGRMADESGAMEAVWAVLLAYYQRLATGVGDHLDLSVFEAALQVVDPPIGTVGTARAAMQGAAVPLQIAYAAERGRPATYSYPIFPCADGYVRLLALAPRQWHNLRAWLGEPTHLQDPKLDSHTARMEMQEEINALCVGLLQNLTKGEAAREAQRRGVILAPVNTVAETLVEPHFHARGAFVDEEIAPGVTARVPSGFVEVDGERIGFRRRAPRPGEHNDDVIGELSAPTTRASKPAVPRHDGFRRPLEGVRVLDFGVIVFGAEVGRVFADMGAEVIKIEDEAYPDGLRQSPPGGGPSASFAVGHRNEKSFGVNLRAPEGVDVFRRLCAVSDVVLSNFKPGTLEKLGISYEDLRAEKPDLIWMAASAVGDTGPWSSWAGYGPLVRCAAGLTSLWRYPDDPASFSDQTSVYPDHYGARIAAATTLAALVRRRRSGGGADIRVSQAECVINMLADVFAHESLEAGSASATGNDSGEGAPWNVYPCAGDDEWCVITVRDGDDWARFVEAIGAPACSADRRFATPGNRRTNVRALDERVSTWTRARTPDEVMERLQAAGVPAGAMRRVVEIVDDPQLAHRGFITELDNPGFDPPLLAEDRPFHARHIPPPPRVHAPVFGQHTEALCRELLGMEVSEIAKLVDLGVLEVEKPTADATIETAHG